MFLMMQGGGGRRKRSTSEDGLLMNITHEGKYYFLRFGIACF